MILAIQNIRLVFICLEFEGGLTGIYIGRQKGHENREDERETKQNDWSYRSTAKAQRDITNAGVGAVLSETSLE
jgi:hypothetical protein